MELLRKSQSDCPAHWVMFMIMILSDEWKVELSWEAHAWEDWVVPPGPSCVLEFWSLNKHTSVFRRPEHPWATLSQQGEGRLCGHLCLSLCVGMGQGREMEFYDMQNKWPHTRLIVPPTPWALRAADNCSPFQDFKVAHRPFKLSSSHLFMPLMTDNYSWVLTPTGKQTSYLHVRHFHQHFKTYYS